MTVGVQVIAENLDSVNDVARKVQILESVSESVSKLEKKFDKLNGLEEMREDLIFINEKTFLFPTILIQISKESSNQT